MIKDYDYIEEILFKKSLCCCPPENESCKLFAQFLNDHPEYSINEIDARIDSEYEEEDYHGHGGGYRHTLVIFKMRKETDDEYKTRIKKEEDSIIQMFADDIDTKLEHLIETVNYEYPDPQKIYEGIKKVLKDRIRNLGTIVK